MNIRNNTRRGSLKSICGTINCVKLIEYQGKITSTEKKTEYGDEKALSITLFRIAQV